MKKIKNKELELELQNTYNFDTLETLNEDVIVENKYDSEVEEDGEENN